MRQGLTTAATLVLLVLTAATASGKSIEERKWIRMESQNFTIHSVLKERKTRELLKHLEAVRSLFLAGNEDHPQSMVPTVIYALGGNKDFKELGLDPYKYAGLFMARLRENTVIIRDAYGMNEAEIIIHEYVHYLQNNNLRFPYPKWYQEGYAEYVSTSATDHARLNVGSVDRNTVLALSHYPWLHIEMIIDSSYFPTLDDRDDISMFYSQSWLLTHYLLNRDGGETYVLESLLRYASALQNGSTEVEAFEQGFEVTLEQLNKELRSYHQKGAYKYFWYPIEPLIGDFSPVSTRLTEAEISAKLADLIRGLQFGESEHDEKLLAKARQLYDLALQDEQTRARAEIGLAYLLEMDGKASEAEDYLALGASRDPDDFFVQLDAAQFWLNRLGDENHNPSDLVSSADPHLRRALAMDKANPEAVYTAGKYLLANGKIEEAIRVWKIAVARAPAVQVLRWELAVLLLGNGQPDEALTYAENFLLLSHGNEASINAARSLIENIKRAHRRQVEESN